jgi:hypothetical protein
MMSWERFVEGVFLLRPIQGLLVRTGCCMKGDVGMYAISKDDARCWNLPEVEV